MFICCSTFVRISIGSWSFEGISEHVPNPGINQLLCLSPARCFWNWLIQDLCARLSQAQLSFFLPWIPLLWTCPLCAPCVSPVLCGAPPSVDNAFLIGRKRSHYDIHSIVRYQCGDGFLQRHVPTAKCRANGKWDRPKIICIRCEFHAARFSQTLLKAVLLFVLFLARSPPRVPNIEPTLAALRLGCHCERCGSPALLSLLIIASKNITVAVAWINSPGLAQKWVGILWSALCSRLFFGGFFL